jgi:NAD(P)H-hydrate epimerase
MKILSIAQLREADEQTIKNEPIAPVDLMERAATSCVDWLTEHLDDTIEKLSFALFCGPGNNGGDGLAMARLLNDKGYAVTVWLVEPKSATFSEAVQINLERLKECGVSVLLLNETTELPTLEPGSIIIDALFGSGLSRALEGWLAKLVGHLNAQSGLKVAIDVPSGLFGEDNSHQSLDSVVQADLTLTFQSPKLAFLLPTTGGFAGWVMVLDIGLDDQYISNVDTAYTLVTGELARQMIPTRPKFAHKGHFGHALLVCGRKGMMGAAVMAAKAAFRAGVGKLTAYVPQCGLQLLQTTIPEAMVTVGEDQDSLTETIATEGFQAVGIGPGIGTGEQTERMLKRFIQETKQPLVLDADALNLLAANPTWLAFLPKNSILTPHPGEFKRLTNGWESDMECLTLQRNLAVKHGIYIVLKGAHTAIATPQGKVFFNSTGNPGMATAGSGDALTGIITALLAQQLHPQEAALLGVYLHGKAGDLAKEKYGEQGMMTSDLIECIPAAFTSLE